MKMKTRNEFDSMTLDFAASKKGLTLNKYNFSLNIFCT